MIPDLEQIKKKWDNQAQFYTQFDSGPQTFYYTLINLLKIQKSKNILEIACGAGLLLPYAIRKKLQTTPYIATDISQQMIKIAHARLKNNFQLFESKLTYEEWIEKNKIYIKKVNGEEKVEGYGKFDTIICNLVLMFTPSPQKILTQLYDVAEDNAQLGLTIWGDPKKNNFLTVFGKAIDQLGIENLKQRSPFWLHPAIDQIIYNTGWQTVFKWEQNAAYPFYNYNDLKNYLNWMVEPNIKKLNTDVQDKVRIKCQNILFNEFKNKTPLIMSTSMRLLKKVAKKI